MPPKILVGCPTFSGMRYCHNEFFSNLKKLTYENHDILIVENSKEDDYFNELKTLNYIKLIKERHEGEVLSIFKLISSRNKILEYALENKYDYVLMLDSDVLVQEDIIQELLAHEKDIISGIYYNYFKVGSNIKYNPVCWLFLSEREFDELKKKVKLPNSTKDRLDIRRFLTEEEAKTGKTFEVAIPSAGCMLLSRNVFSEIKYGKLDSDISKKRVDDDIYFLTKAREKGFKAYCDTSLKCEHIIKGKYEKIGDNFIHRGFKDLAEKNITSP